MNGSHPAKRRRNDSIVFDGRALTQRDSEGRDRPCAGSSHTWVAPRPCPSCWADSSVSNIGATIRPAWQCRTAAGSRSGASAAESPPSASGSGQDSLDLLAYLPAVEHLPRICVHHDVESALFERRARCTVFPNARRERPPVRWIGSASEQDRIEFDRAEGLVLTGYVKDERPLMRDAACFIVPLRVASGTRLESLNAWAMGLPAVSSTIDCGGLDARVGKRMVEAYQTVLEGRQSGATA